MAAKDSPSEEELLQVWLNDTGHAEDEWAERLLGELGNSE